MAVPTDRWEWDAEAGEVVALDVSDTRDGEAIRVDFSDEPVGLLAAAAPDMARALVEVGAYAARLPGGLVEQLRAALRKAKVLP